MGRPRTPSHLKVMNGSATHDPGRVNRDEPKPDVVDADVRPPTWLKLSPLARRAWRDLVPVLRGMGVLTTADRVALALLCDSLASYVTAKRIASTEGSTYETTSESGATMIRAHPVVAMGEASSRFAKVMLGEFGLTPATRGKVSRADGSAQDPVTAWLEGKAQ